MDVELSTLVLVPAVAVLAPLLVRASGRWIAIPIVVFEIVLGILVGPAVLGWARPDAYLDLLAEFGLAMLFFVAGSEIDFRAIRGRPITRAGLGWLLSLGAGLAVALLFAETPAAAVFIGVALTSTALGALMPVLRDAGFARTPFGTAVIAVGAIGEFGPLLAISVFLGGRSPVVAAAVLAGFAVIAGLAMWLAARAPSGRMHRIITATLHTSAQFAIRLVMLILFGLVALSLLLGIDMLIGAFAAGVIFRLLLDRAPEGDARVVEMKLEGVAFGLLVPVFFIDTGIGFDLDALVASPSTLALVPIFVLLLLVIRGLPSTLAAPPGSSIRDRASLALFGGTGLPIIVAVTALGVEDGVLDTGIAAALVGAGMLTVLVFPVLALLVRGARPSVLQPGDPELAAGR